VKTVKLCQCKTVMFFKYSHIISHWVNTYETQRHISLIAIRGHLEISTDIFGGQNWGLGAARI
jgi:hypothetical protein